MEDRPDSFTAYPEGCIARGPSFDGTHAFCSLMRAWGCCLQQGCYVTPGGSLCEADNSPEAMAKRLSQMNRYEKENNK